MTENRLFDVSPQGRSPQSPRQGGAAPQPRRQSGRSVVALGGGHGLGAGVCGLRLLTKQLSISRTKNPRWLRPPRFVTRSLLPAWGI